MKKYFLIINNNQCGPYSISDLQNINFNKSTLVWHSGLKDWTKAEYIEDLESFLNETPPPIPTINEGSIQRILVESPIEINVQKKRNRTEQEIQSRLKNATKKILSETGLIILLFLLSAFFSFAFYVLGRFIEKPVMVSDENQRLFNNELDKRIQENSYTTAFGDIYYDYLGIYDYDDKLGGISSFYNINQARLNYLEEKYQKIAWYVFYIMVGVLITIRYVIRLSKWLNSDFLKEKNSPQTS